MMLKSLTSAIFLLPSFLLVQAVPMAKNCTFTMTVISPSNTNPIIVNQPVLVNPISGISGVVVGTGFAPGTAEPIVAWIYGDQIFRKCTTSPTGACIGMLSKAFGGALTGWYFDFSDSETPVQVGAAPPSTTLFSVRNDPDAPASSPCKPKQKVLYHTGDQYQWTLCTRGDIFPNTYAVNSAPIPDFAHNGKECIERGLKFKVTYTK